MRIVIICLSLIAHFILFNFGAFALSNESSAWKTIAESPWVQILVEKKLYRKSASERFFVHVSIKNISTKTIAFDISKRSLFYINQWCAQNEPYRGMIDETRLNKPIMALKDTQYLIDIFNHKGAKSRENAAVVLLKLKPGKVFDYYIAFNNGYSTDVKHSRARYIIIVMDGHMLFTDGKEAQVVERDSDDNEKAEVSIAANYDAWAQIPAFVRIFEY